MSTTVPVISPIKVIGPNGEIVSCVCAPDCPCKRRTASG
jgi:hypothetical protein